MVSSKVLSLFFAVAGISLTLTSAANAQTLAYWRFEDADGDVGEELFAPGFGASNEGGIRTADPLTNGRVPVADSSGNGNVLRTFHTEENGNGTSPRFSADVPFGTVPQTGAANTKSLFFDGNTLPGEGDDLYTFGTNNVADPINSETFGTGFTIEMSFRLDVTTNYDTLIGRDAFNIPGAPDNRSAALYFQTIGSQEGAAAPGSLAIKVIDVNGVSASVYSQSPLTPNAWYNAVAVSSGGTMSLYLALTGQPLDATALQGSTAQSGSLFGTNNTWTVGRGFFNNQVADWIEGSMDEVRITEGGLGTSGFLANASVAVVPEPGTALLAMLGFAGVGLGTLRRRSR